MFAIVATASTDNASTPVEVPESTTWLLMSLGLLALGCHISSVPAIAPMMSMGSISAQGFSFYGKAYRDCSDH